MLVVSCSTVPEYKSLLSEAVLFFGKHFMNEFCFLNITMSVAKIKHYKYNFLDISLSLELFKVLNI